MLMEPPSFGQGANQGSIETAGRRVVNVLDSGGERKLRFLQAPGEPSTPLLISQQSQALIKRERVHLRVMQLRFIRVRHPGEPEVAERLEGLLCQHQCRAPSSVK